MKKTIICGMVDKPKEQVGLSMVDTGFTWLNGDIEINKNGEEVYVTTVFYYTKDGQPSWRDVRRLVKNLSPEVQDYIKKYKRKVEVRI